MTTRAAINILGSDGSIIDVTSLGTDSITSEHSGVGQYLVHGTLGMAPPPEGWGYVLNQMDADKAVAISFADGLLLVEVSRSGEPADLDHSITLHVAVEDAPQVQVPVPTAPVEDALQFATRQLQALRMQADYAIAPLQDAVDLDDATDAEVAALKAWKKYRVALSRVPDQPGYPDAIDWPVTPA